MIQGVAILRASQLRTPIERTTKTASVSTAAFGGFRTVTRRRSGHAAPRGRERATARTELPKTLGDLGQRGAVRGKPCLFRGACDFTNDCPLHDGSAGRLLEGRRIGVGDP